MKLKQILAIVLSMALVACISIAATVAYLTDTEAVENTFKVGKVDITLDETQVGTDGKIDPSASPQPTHANEYFLVPGNEYDKDPTLTVIKDSEDCWIFVKVANGIAAIETTVAGETIEDQINAKGWTELASAAGDGFKVYYKEHTKAASDTEYDVFDTFAIRADATNAELAANKDNKITVTGYAVQKANVDTVGAAWDLVKAL